MIRDAARRRSFLAPCVLFAALAGAAGAAETAKAPPPPALTLAAVSVTPAKPGPDTLCQLRVDLKNGGDRIASQLAFSVKVNGQELPVYRNQLFMQRLDPGTTTTLRLYNFWTTESGRPAPADGRYRVEITLVAAQWYRIGTEDGVEVWTPLEPVPGLPIAAAVTVGR